MPARIDGIARRHLQDPVKIRIEAARTAEGDAPLVRQQVYVVLRAHKAAALGRILDVEAPGAALVFCRTRTEVDQLTETLNGRGYRAEALHGGMDQEQRDRVMGRLRSGTADLLVATDVAARGLDVDLLTHVVNYDVPSAPEAYVHRIGRVGRAGREGVAITLAEPRERRLLENIERSTKQRIEVATIPSAADLRARRLELTHVALRDAILEGGLEPYEALVERLADEFDLAEVALAAVKLAHEGSGVTDEEEIPEVSFRRDRDRDDRPRREHGREQSRDRYGRDQERGRGRGPSGPSTRIFVGLGRHAGVRPGDLVGAIANETDVSGREIGAIEIKDKFSLVEVPAAAADRVIDALRATTIKGKKVTVRRERFER
jgi:ATP-dependent RNA helicase DeaD